MHFMEEIFSQTGLYCFQCVVFLLAVNFVMGFDVAELIVRWFWFFVTSCYLFSIGIYRVDGETIIVIVGRISSKWLVLVKSVVILLIRLNSWLIESFCFRLAIQRMLTVLFDAVIVTILVWLHQGRNTMFHISISFAALSSTSLVKVIIFLLNVRGNQSFLLIFELCILWIIIRKFVISHVSPIFIQTDSWEYVDCKEKNQYCVKTYCKQTFIIFFLFSEILEDIDP